MNRRPTTPRRALHLLQSACALALLQSQAAQAQTTWTNGSADGLWATGANWSAGVPGAGNDALLTGAPAGTISLGTTAQGAAAMNLSFSGGDYLLQGGAGSSLTFGNLSHTAGTNTIAVPIISAGATFIDGGSLTLSNTSLTTPNNWAGATIDVATGGTLTAKFGGTKPASGPSGSSSIAGSNLNLNGGTLILGGNNYDGGAGGLTAQLYGQEVQRTARVEFNSLSGITGLFNTSTPDALTSGTDAITVVDFGGPTPGTTAAVFASLGHAATDNVMATWKGKFVAPSAGTYTFGGNSDDGIVVYVNGTLVLNRNNFQGFAADPPAGTISLSEGAHDIFIAFYEGSGSGMARVFKNDPANDAAGIPLALSDLTAAQPFTQLGNNVTLTASSTIAPENTYGVGLGTLTANTPGTTLTTGRAGRMDGYTKFSGTNFGASGTYNFNTISDLGLGLVSDGTSTVTITKTGNGNLILDHTATAADTNGTTFDIQAGRLLVSRTNTGNNPIGNSTIQLNGAGSVVQFNLIEAAAGNGSFDNAIQVNESARIESTNHSSTSRELVIGSASRGISIATGKTLTFWAGDTANTRLSGVISGAGDVVFSAQNDAGNAQGFHFVNALNTYTGKTTIENGASVRLDVANALNSSSHLDIAGGGRLEFFAVNSFNSNLPRIVSRAGTFFRVNNANAMSSGTLELGPGRVIEFQTANALTGGATISRAPGSIFSFVTGQVPFAGATTQVGVRASDVRSLDLIRIGNTMTGAGDDVISHGLGATPAGTIIQTTGADRNISNTNIQELNGQIIMNDGTSRTLQDGNRLDIGSLGAVLVPSSGTNFTTGTTLVVAENFSMTAASGKLTIGANIPLDNRISLGTVALTNATGSDFTGTTTSAAKAVEVIAGVALEGRADSDGTTGFGTVNASNLGVNLARGTLRALQSTANTATTGTYSTSIGKLFVTGAGTVNVNRNTGTAGVITELRLGAPIERTTGATLGLLSQNNALGGDERVVFVTPTDAPASFRSITAVQPYVLNVSNSTANFVTTGANGFVNAGTTTIADAAALQAANATTIGNTSAALTLAAATAYTVGALRATENISGGAGTTLTIDAGGLIISNSTAAKTISAPLVFPTGVEPIVWSGGGQAHTISGTITSDSGFTKWGPNTLTLSGNNTSTLFGDIRINEFNLSITNDTGLGALSNRVILGGGVLRFSGNVTSAREIVVNSGGGQFNNENNRTVTLTGPITGDGALTFITTTNNSGVVRLQQPAGTDNTFAGSMTINGGIVEFSRNAQLGALPDTSDFDRGHIVFNDSNTNATLRLASGAGSVSTDARQFTVIGTGRFDVAGANDTLTVANDIRGSGSLIKQGTGTLILSNPDGNGYAGTTTINAGALLANNTTFTATGSGAVVVNNNGLLGGSGIIEGAITGNTGSTLSPGGSLAAGDAGLLRGQGGLTLNDNAAFKWSLEALSNSNPGVDYDRFVLDFGPLAITSGANFTFDFGTGIAPSGDAFWAANQTWSDVIQVTGFATIGNAGAFDIDNTPWSALGSFSLSSDTSGYDLAWTPVPEPGSVALMLGGAVLLGASRRRGRSKQA